MDVAQLLARLRASSASFSSRQMIVIAGAFVAVVGGIIGASYYNAPGYHLLFADMDPAAASEVVDKLKTQKIAYKLEDSGRSIRVPEDRVDELRLTLTAQGLPSSGRVGFEIFDRTAFGATEFQEHVNYRRALEGEIARTITTIGEVASARVHIAMGKESLFESREQAAKASVILKLKGRQALSASTVTGIAGLVASSVEGLRPEAVVILDNFGHSLSRPADADESSGFGLERQQRVEHELSARVTSLLEPVVGVGRVRVNVAARLNAEAREETEEKFDPTTVVRSHQTNQDTQTLPVASTGAAGARSNIAPPPTPPGTPPQLAEAKGTGPGSSRAAETTNYEVSKLVRHSIIPRGQLSRLWVAVILDDDVQMQKGTDGKLARKQRSRTAPEIQKIQNLVSSAVGLDPERGDQLTVENVTFDSPVADLMEETAPVKSSPRLRWVIVGVVGALVVLVLIVLVTRRVLARKKTSPEMEVRVELPSVLPKTVEQMQHEIDAEMEAESAAKKVASSHKLPALVRRVGALAAKEPETAAMLLRSWLMEEQR